MKTPRKSPGRRSRAIPTSTPIGTGASKPKKSKAKAKAKGLVHHLDEAITWFEKTYPKKFEDEKFVDADMRNKRTAHDVYVANFGGKKGQAMVDAGKHGEIADVIDALFRATNIPSTFEVKAVHKGLKKNEDAGTHILEAAIPFIEKPDSAKFAHLFETVAQLPADGGKVLTWPNVTLLPFLANPKKFMALKPIEHRVDGGADEFRSALQHDAQLAHLRSDAPDEQLPAANGLPCSARRT